MKFWSNVLILTLLLPLTGAALAAEPVSSNLGVEAVSPEHFRSPQHQRPFPRAGVIVKRYIEEKTASGEIDPTEYNQLKQQRQSLRQEMKALRQSGDTAAMEEKMDEIRQQRHQQREYVRGLVNENPELKQRLAERRLDIRRQRLDRRQDMLERRRERLQDRRLRDGAS